jgi:hypothetical protein
MPEYFLYPENVVRMAPVFYARVARSPYNEPRLECADYYLLPHFMSKNASKGLEMLEYVQARCPHFNRTVALGQARHLLYLGNDHGPGDSFFKRPLTNELVTATKHARTMAVHASPADPNRTVAFLVFNGLNDTVKGETGFFHCRDCFQHGRDIRLPTPPEGHPCGPFCGDTPIDMLRKYSPWSLPQPERDAALRKARPIRFWWVGAVRRTRSTMSARPALAQHHSGRKDWMVINTMAMHGNATHPARGPPGKLPPMWEALSSSDFCGSPLGWDYGDSDRYLPAVLYGCIPIFFHTTEERPLEEILNWDSFSIRMDVEDIPRLHEILEQYSHERVVAMRQAMTSAWERLLYTSYAGVPEPYRHTRRPWRLPKSFLGETGERDAFDGVMTVLRRRLAREARAAALR